MSDKANQGLSTVSGSGTIDVNFAKLMAKKSPYNLKTIASPNGVNQVVVNSTLNDLPATTAEDVYFSHDNCSRVLSARYGSTSGAA
jgi:hypothetical protein